MRVIESRKMIDVLAALDQAPGPLGDDLGDRDVVLGREVGGGGDDLAARDAAAEVGDLLGPLVDEEHDDVHVGVVDRRRRAPCASGASSCRPSAAPR